MLGRNRAPFPGMRRAGLIGGQAEALAFGILEIERAPPVRRRDIAEGEPLLAKPGRPVIEARLVDAQARPADRMRAPRLPADGPVEEGEI